MDTLYEELVMLVYSGLRENSPVLSGNMLAHIEYANIDDNETTIVISGPSYDLEEWEKTKQIILTNEYDYALWVNKFGAFGTGNKSKHWVNRALVDRASVVASDYDAELIVDIERD